MFWAVEERLKDKFLEEEKLVDIVVGPDAYRDLPNFIDNVKDGQKPSTIYKGRNICRDKSCD